MGNAANAVDCHRAVREAISRLGGGVDVLIVQHSYECVMHTSRKSSKVYLTLLHRAVSGVASCCAFASLRTGRL